MFLKFDQPLFQGGDSDSDLDVAKQPSKSNHGDDSDGSDLDNARNKKSRVSVFTVFILKRKFEVFYNYNLVLSSLFVYFVTINFLETLIPCVYVFSLSNSI